MLVHIHTHTYKPHTRAHAGGISYHNIQDTRERALVLAKVPLELTPMPSSKLQNCLTATGQVHKYNKCLSFIIKQNSAAASNTPCWIHCIFLYFFLCLMFLLVPFRFPLDGNYGIILMGLGDVCSLFLCQMYGYGRTKYAM